VPAQNLHSAVPDYVLLERIGAGSYGEVWRARSVTGVERAIKVVRRRSFDSDRPYQREFDGIRRFESLARGHPHLVTVFHVGRSEGEESFHYVMELADPANVPRPAGDEADGLPVAATSAYQPRTLREELQQRGHLPVAEVVEIGLALCDALDHLHGHGLIHRDVKPSNIIFVGGMPKLADIGLVAEVGESKSFVGTEGFVPPEGPGSVQGDIYSLGKVLYEAATGRDRVDFPELPASIVDRPDHGAILELNEILLRACERDRSKRYASAGEFIGELQLLRAGNSLRRLHQAERRLRRATRLGMVGLFVLALSITASWWARREASRQRANVLAAEALQSRAEAAERAAREQLHDTAAALARASRSGLRAGRRLDALDAVRSGAAVRPSRALRDELVGALACSDLRPAFRLTNTLTRVHPPVPSPSWAEMACPLPGGVSLRSVQGQEERIRLPSPGSDEPMLTWSPEGKWLAARHPSGLSRIWDAADGRVVFEGDRVGAAPSFASDLVLIASPGEHRITLVDLSKRTLVRELAVPFDFDLVALSPDGRRIAINPVGIDTFRVLDALDGSTVHEFPLTASALSLAWSSDSRWMALGSDDQSIYLWRGEGAPIQHRLTGHQNVVHDVLFLAGTGLLASSSWDGTTRLWEVETGREVLRLMDSGNSLQYGASSQLLGMAGYSAGVVRVYEFLPPEVMTTLVLPSTNRLVSPFAVSFHPEGQALAVAAWDGAHVFDGAAPGEILRVPEHWARTAAFLRGGRSLLVAGQDGAMLWDWPPARGGAGGLTGGRRLAPGHGWNVADATPDAGAVVLARDQEVWHLRDGHPTRVLRAAGHRFQTAVISRDGRWIAGGGRLENGYALWDAETGAAAAWGPESTRTGTEVAFSPDGRWFVTGDPVCYRSIPVGESAGGWRIERHDTAGLHGLMAFSSDGKWFACALSRTTVSLHRAGDGERLLVLEAPDPQQVTGLCFDRVGSRLAVACATHRVLIWELDRVGRHVAAFGLQGLED
jgi:WD40 repeat protein